ncbi:MAG TPA: PEGA domain-containing protein [Candidatus Elarobacter sp.]|jgi:hypothetical protein
MLRRLAAIAACVFFLGAVPTGSLYVTTLPSSADVWVDGIYVGRSPLVIDALGAGHHTVGIAKAGWSPQQLDVSIAAAQTTFSSVKLPPAKPGTPLAPGSIVLHGSDLQAVSVDGMPAKPGRDGSIPASAGSHQVAVRTSRGRMTREVQVWPRTRTDVLVQAESEPARPSIVAPADDYLPAGAVKIDGERIVIRYVGHEAVGHIGSTTYRIDGRVRDYDAAPALIGNRLYLPIGVLTAVGGTTDR